jgi:hypothetical protein
MAQGYGAIDPPLGSTGLISTVGPCTASIAIPKRVLYYGVPNASIPPTNTLDCVLDLNIIREAINDNFQP